MKQTIFDGFNSKKAQGYLDDRVYDPRIFKNFFPVKQTAFLSYETLIGSQSQPVAADIVSYDTRSPRKTRKVLSKLKGDIPAIRVARDLTEKDFNTIDQLKAMVAMGSDSAKSQLIDMVYADIDFVTEGVYSRAEWIALQALSQGYIALTAANNDGIVTESNIDFQMPAANQRCVKTATANRAWSSSNLATMTPIVDIMDVVEDFRSSGITFKYLLMDLSTAILVRKCTEVKTALPNVSTAVRIPTMAEVNQLLRTQGLPEIIAVNSYVNIEIAGTQTLTNCWNTSYATFIPNLKLGDMLSAPIAPFNHAGKNVTKAKNADGIAVLKYSKEDPLVESTLGLWNVFPTFPTIDKVVRYTFGSYAASGLAADA